MRIGQAPQTNLGASTAPTDGLLVPRLTSAAKPAAANDAVPTEPLGPLPTVEGVTHLRPTTAVDAADAARDIAQIDASLQRTANALEATRAKDGHWDSTYVGGNAQIAVSAIALADLGVSTSKAKDAEVIAHFVTQQLADGGFPTLPGERSDPGTTRFVALAARMIAKRDPSLAASASAIASKCDVFLAKHPTYAVPTASTPSPPIFSPTLSAMTVSSSPICRSARC